MWLGFVVGFLVVVIVGEGGCIRSDRGWGGLWLGWGGSFGWLGWVVVGVLRVVVGCQFVETVNVCEGDQMKRVIERGERNQ